MRASPSVSASVPSVVTKPMGGFRPITVLQVCMAWWAYRTGLLTRYLDFRVYLALHEVAERRLAAMRVRKHKTQGTLVPVPARRELLGELHGLVGGNSDRLVRGALSRLESARLVTLTGSFLAFADKPSSLENAPLELRTLLDGLTRNTKLGERRLPVPRPILRLLARSATPSLAATVLGYLMRCVWWRGTELRIESSCTAGFISERFGVDIRSVKRARAELRRIGWLVSVGPSVVDDERHVLPNLSWTGAAAERPNNRALPCTVLSPSTNEKDTKLSPHTTTPQLRSGSKYQQPVPQGLAGNRGAKGDDSNPRLADVRPVDLSSVARMDALFEQATSRGLVKRTSADRLRFFAVGARALRLASRNAGGFFAAVVRRGLWHVISQADEDRAIAQLRSGSKELFNRRKVLDRSRENKPSPLGQNHQGLDDTIKIQSLVTSLASHCSMNKSPGNHREYQHDRIPGYVSAARDPFDPRSNGPSEASGRGLNGWDAGCPADGLPET